MNKSFSSFAVSVVNVYQEKLRFPFPCFHFDVLVNYFFYRELRNTFVVVFLVVNIHLLFILY